MPWSKNSNDNGRRQGSQDKLTSTALHSVVTREQHMSFVCLEIFLRITLKLILLQNHWPQPRVEPHAAQVSLSPLPPSNEKFRAAWSKGHGGSRDIGLQFVNLPI